MSACPLLEIGPQIAPRGVPVDSAPAQVWPSGIPTGNRCDAEAAVVSGALCHDTQRAATFSGLASGVVHLQVACIAGTRVYSQSGAGRAAGVGILGSGRAPAFRRGRNPKHATARRIGPRGVNQHSAAHSAPLNQRSSA